ncbi:hypothetical protein [Fictibacillus fluitans]|uniref:Uncharacterized protein n=1 Tax=Fictibacillus fluitans TaxID=3058422 RepID=A0ABT8HT91_9BACL|nr:hypothetical protein [Fictibacillus sp. NE201]MDN4523986.1 hypothetical protein [Fictibacillus sp. NE201]
MMKGDNRTTTNGRDCGFMVAVISGANNERGPFILTVSKYAAAKNIKN